LLPPLGSELGPAAATPLTELLAGTVEEEAEEDAQPERKEDEEEPEEELEEEVQEEEDEGLVPRHEAALVRAERAEADLLAGPTAAGFGPDSMAALMLPQPPPNTTQQPTSPSPSSAPAPPGPA
ncbi:hypothetical protein Agub_g3821, partial [Astrephomene gubernaculifera]